MAGFENTGSHQLEATSLPAAVSALHSDVYSRHGQNPAFSPVDARAASASSLPHVEITENGHPHHWFDGAVAFAEGAVDEVMHHPLHVLESAAIGVGVGLAAVGVAAVAPEVAAVVGIGGAIYGGVELLLNAPKWGREAAVLADPEHHSAADVTAARQDLNSLGHVSVDTVVTAVTGGLAYGIGNSVLAQAAGRAALSGDGALALRNPEVVPPAEALPPAARAAEAVEAPVQPVAVSEAMQGKPAALYERIFASGDNAGPVQVQRIDSPVVLTTASGRTVSGGPGDLLVTRGDGAQAIVNEAQFAEHYSPVRLEVPNPMLEYRKTLPVTAERSSEPFTWTSNGETMQANAGDWRVTQPNGKISSVTPEIFAQTYEAAPELGQNSFLKTAVTRAQVLDRDVTVTTLEGAKTGRAGDYLVTGPAGEQYPVSKAEFEHMYARV